jgi:hypothetical protein
MATGSLPPIPGLLTGWVDTALTVAYFAAPNELTDVTFRLGIAPPSGSVTVKLNVAADGTGDGLEGTFATGEIIAPASGTVTIAAGSYLYQIVTVDDPGAMNLSGDYTVSLASGVTQLLTSLSHVKAYLDITTADAARDLVLNHIMAGVSKRIQNYIDRPIIQTTTTGEKVDSIGDYQIQSRHYPIISVASLSESATALVEDTDFEMTPEDMERGQVTRISGTDPIAWAKGRRVVELSYNHGFAAVPDDLVQLATELTAIKYQESGESGKGWLGLTSKGVDPAASVSFDKDLWTREAVPMLNQYRRMVA